MKDSHSSVLEGVEQNLLRTKFILEVGNDYYNMLYTGSLHSEKITTLGHKLSSSTTYAAP
jgi:hypothetical protein